MYIAQCVDGQRQVICLPQEISAIAVRHVGMCAFDDQFCMETLDVVEPLCAAGIGQSGKLLGLARVDERQFHSMLGLFEYACATCLPM